MISSIWVLTDMYLRGIGLRNLAILLLILLVWIKFNNSWTKLMAYDHEELKEKYTIIRKVKSIKSHKEWVHSYNHKIVSYQRQIFYSKDK